MTPRLALALLFAVALLTGGGLRLIHDHTDTPPPPQPTATSSSSTSADRLVWYRSLPTASGCPKSVAAGLKPFYPQCPNVQEEDPE